ncbi:hypothetical protein Rmet_6715 (plasmid) [Cupriavidus metallidurans CH34]|uniref:Uncharacterized protein n=1 Tax=Cupriavidus metallidurans (strain ATCC 43123 / DSM 2839 / NBRC 102507 / CH34) TaxID=266264 RepID=D3DYC5_CUPMC|nr:hypothetical protein Rmet_6715 [Cupriavidus metallidurans CH34]
MHEAGPDAGVGKPGVFLDRQGIHVGAQAKTPVTVSHAQLANQPRLSDAARYVVSPFLQLPGNQIRSVVLLKGQLRMPMDVLSQRGKLVVQGEQVGKRCTRLGIDGHRQSKVMWLSLAMRW